MSDRPRRVHVPPILRERPNPTNGSSRGTKRTNAPVAAAPTAAANAAALGLPRSNPERRDEIRVARAISEGAVILRPPRRLRGRGGPPEDSSRPGPHPGGQKQARRPPRGGARPQ